LTEADPGDPVSGGGVALLGNIEGLIMGFADLSHDIKRGFNLGNSRPGSPKSSSKRSSRACSPASNTEEVVEDEQSANPASESSSQVIQRSALGASRKGSDASDKTSEKMALRGRSMTTNSQTPSTRTNVTSSTAATTATTATTETRPAQKMDMDSVISAGKSAAKVFNMGFRAPADFTMAVAKGFHNAPLMYNDDTVRESPKVTGFKSGIKAAGRVSLCSFDYWYE
jgi:hypothetical protein